LVEEGEEEKEEEEEEQEAEEDGEPLRAAGVAAEEAEAEAEVESASKASLLTAGGRDGDPPGSPVDQRSLSVVPAAYTISESSPVPPVPPVPGSILQRSFLCENQRSQQELSIVTPVWPQSGAISLTSEF
jgi:hypothetical protein